MECVMRKIFSTRGILLAAAFLNFVIIDPVWAQKITTGNTMSQLDGTGNIVFSIYYPKDNGASPSIVKLTPSGDIILEMLSNCPTGSLIIKKSLWRPWMYNAKYCSTTFCEIHWQYSWRSAR